jgi:hypothetical protein
MFLAAIMGEISNSLKRFNFFRDEAGKEVSAIQCSNTDREKLSIAYLGLAFEAHEDIGNLIERKRYGSAFKLVRSLFEALYDGLWTYALADDVLVSSLLTNMKAELPGNERERAHQVDSVYRSAGAGDFFHDFYDRTWKFMCSYAHNGPLAINRALAGYDDASIQEVLRTTTTMILLFADAWYWLHVKSRSKSLVGLLNTYFAEKW